MPSEGAGPGRFCPVFVLATAATAATGDRLKLIFERKLAVFGAVYEFIKCYCNNSVIIFFSMEKRLELKGKVIGADYPQLGT